MKNKELLLKDLYNLLGLVEIVRDRFNNMKPKTIENELNNIHCEIQEIEEFVRRNF